MVTKVERNNRDDLRLNPKDQYNGSLAAKVLSLKKDKEDVQRSSPDGRVEPEAYAGRKILLHL